MIGKCLSFFPIPIMEEVEKNISGKR